MNANIAGPIILVLVVSLYVGLMIASCTERAADIVLWPWIALVRSLRAIRKRFMEIWNEL